MSRGRVFIIHGYTASPESHWFPWLKTELENRGTAVEDLRMPNAEITQPADWQKIFGALIGTPTAQDFFVAHSLGCVSLLTYLQSLDPAPQIGGLICVAGFTGSLLNLPQLNAFTAQPLDFTRLRGMTANRHVLLSENDMSVRPHHTEKLAEDLQATLLRLPKHGHFLGSEGIVQLPEVLKILEAKLP